MFYFSKTPFWIKKLFPSMIWEIPTKEKAMYLTFDDGPHIEATPFVLDELKKYNAKATFFCLGKNVQSHPEIYLRILDEGHRVGNHSNTHLNGQKVKDELYLKDISEASKIIDSNLFRPPYGRMTKFQIKHLGNAMGRKDVRIIMWDVLSGDFDPDITKEQCLENVILNSKSGSIIVLHDSQKCHKNVRYILPKMLQQFSEKGFLFEKID